MGAVAAVTGGDVNVSVRVFVEAEEEDTPDWVSEKKLEGGMLNDVGVDPEEDVSNL